MKLHEGKLIRRCLIEYRETTSGASTRVLLDIRRWLGNKYERDINKIVLYITALGATSLGGVATDGLYLKVSGIGADVERQVGNIGDDTLGKYPEEIEFPLWEADDIGRNPDIDLKARCPAWAATETHVFQLELEAYLLDVGDDKVLFKAF